MFGQYKLAVEMADRVSARRAAANEFFLTANSIFLSVAGLLIGLRGAGVEFTAAALVLPVVGGLALSTTWILTIEQYKRLNAAKFDVINSFEQYLPAAPFLLEWSRLNRRQGARDSRQRPYWPLTTVERIVPSVFTALYFSLIVFLILA